jgi:hypothetical protein
VIKFLPAPTNLDVIDDMLINEIYGADDAVAAHDRW